MSTEPQPDPVAAVQARQLVVRTARQILTGPVSFTVAHGTTVGVQGPSGAGKSTLLRAIVGLLPAGVRIEGELRVLGRTLDEAGPLADLRAQAVLVGQSPIVFPGSILANAVFGLRHVVRAPRAALRDRAVAALEEAGLWQEVSDRLDAPAEQLSVGQRQRLCLARALALDPAMLLLDEPTSALDAGSRETVEQAVDSLRGRRTIVLVSHDAGQIARLCDEVVVLGKG